MLKGLGVLEFEVSLFRVRVFNLNSLRVKVFKG